MCNLIKWVLTIAVFLLSALADAQDLQVDRIVVYKSERKMVLFSNGKEVKWYRVALGTEPVGPKQLRGDHKTPEGRYILDSRNAHSQFYKAFHISYPSPKDTQLARTLGVSTGGDIMLHGLPKGYEWDGEDWTDGCIALTSNKEMDELWTTVRVGTPIEIKP
jgi:murein L,D-transpeptidase YafK